MIMQKSESLKPISIEELNKNPNLIRQLLLKEEKVSLVLEKDGEVIRLAYLPTYDEETNRILEEAEKEHVRKKQQGYSREEAIQGFLEVQEAISKQL